MEAPNCYDCKIVPWGHKCPHEYETLVRDSATDAERMNLKKQLAALTNQCNRYRNLLIRVDISVPMPILENEDEDNPAQPNTLTVGLIRDIRAALKEVDPVRTMMCTSCHEEYHLNDFETPDLCRHCFAVKDAEIAALRDLCETLTLPGCPRCGAEIGCNIDCDLCLRYHGLVIARATLRETK